MNQQGGNSMSSKQGDLFEDGFEQMVPKRSAAAQQPTSDQDFPKDQLRTSYLLVNVLLTLLIDKGYIQQQEVDNLLHELYAEYKRKVG
jgi:hypothetical protein